MSCLPRPNEQLGTNFFTYFISQARQKCSKFKRRPQTAEIPRSCVAPPTDSLKLGQDREWAQLFPPPPLPPPPSGTRNFSLSPYFLSSSLFGRRRRRRPHLNIAVIPFSADVPGKHVSLSALEAPSLTKGAFTPLLLPPTREFLTTHRRINGPDRDRNPKAARVEEAIIVQLL